MYFEVGQKLKASKGEWKWKKKIISSRQMCVIPQLLDWLFYDQKVENMKTPSTVSLHGSDLNLTVEMLEQIVSTEEGLRMTLTGVTHAPALMGLFHQGTSFCYGSTRLSTGASTSYLNYFWHLLT